MPYSEEIEASIQNVVSGWQNISHKKMFGGTCHLINGNMVCGVYKNFLILRLGEAKAKAAMQRPFVRPFDITGKPMKGWVIVEREGFESNGDLKKWLNKAKEFTNTLPPK